MNVFCISTSSTCLVQSISTCLAYNFASHQSQVYKIYLTSWLNSKMFVHAFIDLKLSDNKRLGYFSINKKIYYRQAASCRSNVQYLLPSTCSIGTSGAFEAAASLSMLWFWTNNLESRRGKGSYIRLTNSMIGSAALLKTLVVVFPIWTRSFLHNTHSQEHTHARPQPFP